MTMESDEPFAPSRVEHQPTPDEFRVKVGLTRRMFDVSLTLCKQRRAIGANMLRAQFGTDEHPLFEGCGAVLFSVYQSGRVEIALGAKRDPSLHFENQHFVLDEAMLTERMT
jgi:hypothetical protein